MATSYEIDHKLSLKYCNEYTEMAHGGYREELTKEEMLKKVEKMIRTETNDRYIINELLDDAAYAYDEWAEHGHYSTPMKYNKIEKIEDNVKDTVTGMQQNGEVAEVIESELEKATREEGILSDLESKLTESKYAERPIFGKCFITDYKKELIKLSIPTLSDFVMKPLSKRFKLDKKQKISFIKDIIRQKPENERTPTGDEKLDKELGLVKLTPVDVVGIFGNGIDPEFDGLYTESVTGTGKVKITAHIDDIAKRVIETLHVITYKDNVYCYNNGLYINSKELVRAEAARIINGIYTDVASSGISRNLNDVMTDIMTHNPLPEYPFNKTKNALNVKNGVIIFDEITGVYKLEDQNPDKYIFNYQLPIEYNPNADSTPIMDIIRKYSDKYDAIIQILAQTFLQAIGKKTFKTAYLLYGQPDYGKSTILLEILPTMIGDYYSQIALGRFSADQNNRFALAPLEGKLMNLKDELSYFKMADSTTFKDVVGTYKIWVEPKGVDPYPATSTAVHVYAANDTPSFDGRIRDDDAFWKRWVLIPCNKTKFERDESYVDRCITTPENMSGLLNVVLGVMSDYMKGTPLKYRSNVGDEWENVREEWMRAGSPLYRYITENFVKGGETSLIKEELLMSVQSWCDVHLMYKKSRPETVNSLIDTIRLCNGTIDGRKNFYKYTEEELSTKVGGKSKISFSDRNLCEEKYCYIIPWTWKKDSEFKNNFRPASNPRK